MKCSICGLPIACGDVCHTECVEARDAARGWVSVEDGLPEASGRYLVLDEDGNHFDAEYDGCIDYGCQFGEWSGYYDPHTLGFLDSEWKPYSGITHWMPLPEPPKEMRK